MPSCPVSGIDVRSLGWFWQTKKVKEGGLEETEAGALLCFQHSCEHMWRPCSAARCISPVMDLSCSQNEFNSVLLEIGKYKIRGWTIIATYVEWNIISVPAPHSLNEWIIVNPYVGFSHCLHIQVASNWITVYNIMINLFLVISGALYFKYFNLCMIDCEPWQLWYVRNKTQSGIKPSLCWLFSYKRSIMLSFLSFGQSIHTLSDPQCITEWIWTTHHSVRGECSWCTGKLHYTLYRYRWGSPLQCRDGHKHHLWFMSDVGLILLYMSFGVWFWKCSWSYCGTFLPLQVV